MSVIFFGGLRYLPSIAGLSMLVSNSNLDDIKLIPSLLSRMFKKMITRRMTCKLHQPIIWLDFNVVVVGQPVVLNFFSPPLIFFALATILA